MTLRKTLAVTIAIMALCCFSASDKLVAATVPNAAPMITYTAAGTFSSTPTSGADTLKLAGEPFSVSITVSASTAPFQHGSNWAAFHQLKLTGSVHSGLLGPTPVNIASSEASIIQAISPGQYDLFTMQAPVKVVGISLTIKAQIVMPVDTISKPLLHPFAAVAMGPGNATVTYSNTTDSTVLAIDTGGLTATIPTGPAVASALRLPFAGAPAVTLHSDGTWSARFADEAAPVELAIATGTAIVRFSASGVSRVSESA